ncbi:hypothetical protein SAMN06265379_102343 [Saccharicrinis carchari]|uniref:Uncharacterized protein n=1 Tax=Saccharicrinis carchari TaxID=1168039 RepID=A0A521C3A9_SACCC|nr:hypothetical protein SAMN06265379_102343 [Saccharicrinis carchari]
MHLVCCISTWNAEQMGIIAYIYMLTIDYLRYQGAILSELREILLILKYLYILFFYKYFSDYKLLIIKMCVHI